MQLLREAASLLLLLLLLLENGGHSAQSLIHSYVGEGAYCSVACRFSVLFLCIKPSPETEAPIMYSLSSFYHMTS